jgi:hypothetical protein
MPKGSVTSVLEIPYYLHGWNPQETLIVWDIDNTLITTETISKDNFIAKHIDTDELIYLVDVKGKKYMKFVEPETVKYIKMFDQKKYHQICLTARKHIAADYVSRTIPWITEMESFSGKELSFETDTMSFKKGILLVGTQNKGEKLVELLKKFSENGFHIKNVLFIDDYAGHVINVDQALSKTIYNYWSIQYTPKKVD